MKDTLGIIVAFFLFVFLSWFFAGCSSQAGLVDSLAKDPASNCVLVSTPYGGVLIGRATAGVRLSLAGGSCTVDGTGATVAK